MKNRLITITKALIILTAFTLMFCGCGKSSKKPSPQMQSQQGELSEKPPEQLKKLEDTIEKIIKTLNEPATSKEGEKAQKEGQDQSKGSSEQQGNQGQQGQGGEQNKQGQGGQQSQQGQGGQQGQTSQKQQQDPWQQVKLEADNLHFQWSSYMPMAVKMHANKNLVDNFSDAINSLSRTITGKDKDATLLSANHVYEYIPDFYLLYKSKASPEIKRIRYFTRNIMLNSETSNWDKAQADINSLKASWSLYKNTIPKEQQETSNQLDFSINELEKVIKEKSQPLVSIKGKVTLSNVENLEKAQEK